MILTLLFALGVVAGWYSLGAFGDGQVGLGILLWTIGIVFVCIATIEGLTT